MKVNDIYFLLHLENYRIGFISFKNWKKDPYNYKFKNWIYSYYQFFPDCYTEIRQIYICGFGFGRKINNGKAIHRHK